MRLRIPLRPWLAAGSVVGGLVAYVLLRYADAVGTFFFLDDFWLLRDARRVAGAPGSSLLEIFRPGHAGLTLYRPLTQVGYFYALRQWFGLDAAPYHAFQVLLFAGNSVLVAAIVRRLTGSWAWAAVAGLLYAAAPGHALAVYWMAAATMTGTATLVLLALWWWLATRGVWRAAGAALLQAAALAGSEHAVVLPLLLGWVVLFGPDRAPPRAQWRGLAPAALLTAAYGAVKLFYFARYGGPHGAYALSGDAAGWLTSLGYYALACGNVATLLELAPPHAIVLGAGLLLGGVGLAVVALRRGGAWRLPALGLALFGTALLPVLPLTMHYFDYFIGVAALGMVVFLVGVCRAVPRGGLALGLAGAALVLAVDRRTCDEAVRDESAVSLMRAAGEKGRQLLRDLDHTARLMPPGATILVPESPLARSMITVGQAQAVFFDPPLPVRYGGGAPAADSGPVVPPLAADPAAPTPGSRADWDWLRAAAAAAHRWYAGPCAAPVGPLPAAEPMPGGP